MWMEAWGMPFAVQPKSTNYLHFVDVELLKFFLISWKYLQFFHRSERKCQLWLPARPILCVLFFFADFLLKICAILHLERNPPSAKIPAASTDHLLCTDTNDLGEISGRGVAHQQNSHSRIFTRKYPLQNQRNTHDNILKLERSEKYLLRNMF